MLNKIIFLFIFYFSIILQLKGQIITTVAGGGTSYTGTWGDGGPATDAAIGYFGSFVIDNSGNIYLPGNANVRKVDAITGIITTIAGSSIGVAGFSGDGGPATNALLYGAAGLSIDSGNNLYISDEYRIRKLNLTTGIITTIAGNGYFGSSGDGGPATNARIYGGNTACDTFGNIYLGDSDRIRKIDTSGIITTIAGTGMTGCDGNDVPASTASFNSPLISSDKSGNIYFSSIDSCVTVRKITINTGIITIVAGTDDHIGIPYSGDGMAATACHIYPFIVAIDDTGILYIADYENQRVEKVDTFGIIHTVAGTGTPGFSGDNGPATATEIKYPEGVALDKCGNLYIADFGNQRIRKVTFDTSCSLTHPTAIRTPHPAPSLSIFPNPATSQITITSNEVINNVVVTNMLGEVVYSCQLSANSFQVDVGNWADGVYFVRVNNEVKKLVKM